MKNISRYEKDTKIMDDISKNKIKCPNCGHTLILNKQIKILCDYCGIYVFKNELEEFKYRLKEQLLKRR